MMEESPEIFPNQNWKDEMQSELIELNVLIPPEFNSLREAIESLKETGDNFVTITGDGKKCIATKGVAGGYTVRVEE